MPLMTGVEAAPVLKLISPQTTIILFTIDADDIPKSLDTLSGIDITLSKAGGLSGLAERLNSLLAPTLPLPELPRLP